MGVDYALQFKLFFYALALGIVLGIIYDCFRLLRVFSGGSRVLVFIEDLVFCLFTSLCIIILLYNLSYGLIRLFAFAGFSAGFIAYYLTLGKLTRKIFVRLRDFLVPLYEKYKIKFIGFCKRKYKKMRSNARYRELVGYYKKGCGLKIN